VQVSEEAHSLLVDPVVEIAALVVDETCRSQGIGSALVKRSEEWASSKGYKTMRVRSNIKREAAHRFYQREGFFFLKTGHYFIKEGL
jgi:GNAT superfamily N-acetyltransferase